MYYCIKSLSSTRYMKDFIKKLKRFFKNLFKRNKKEIEEERKLTQKEPTVEKEKGIPEYKATLHFGNNHWQLFTSFINKAEKEIKIMTGSVSDTALSLILEGVKQNIDIKIITGRGRGYNNIFLMENIGMEHIKQCARLHAKFCIIDRKLMISGSSNITKGSLGDKEGRSGFFEADIVIVNENIIRSAEHLFDILWKEKNDISVLKNNSGFISSAFGVPLRLKELVEKATQEIVVIVPPFLSLPDNYISISRYIRELNPNVKIKIITAYRIGKDHLDGYNEIKSFKNTKIVLVRNRIHAKVYMFDSKIAVVSSINLTFTSWITSLEAGIIVRDESILELLKSTISQLETNEVPISTKDTEDNEPSKPRNEDIEFISPKFETEGEKIRNSLKATLVPRSEVTRKGSKNGGEGKHLPPKEKTLSVTAIKPKMMDRKKRSKFTYLSSWTFNQLEDYCRCNRIIIPPIVNKKSLIKTIRESNPKSLPRLTYLKNILQNCSDYRFRDVVNISRSKLYRINIELYLLPTEIKDFPEYPFPIIGYGKNEFWEFIAYHKENKKVIEIVERHFAKSELTIYKTILKKYPEILLKIFPSGKPSKIKNEKKRPRPNRYPNLIYWTIPQLKRYAKNNGILLKDDKKELIKNIENAKPKNIPRLDFIRNLLKNERVFNKYVELALNDDLISFSLKLTKRYNGYNHYSHNPWHHARQFVLSNKKRKFVIDLLEQKLAKKENKLRTMLKSDVNIEDFLLIFPDEMLEEKGEEK